MAEAAAQTTPGAEPIFGVRSLARSTTRISGAEAERLAAEHWGIAGRAVELPAEVDENFRLETAERTLLLKVMPADEAEELTDFVTRALLHVADRLEEVCVQEVVATAAGRPLASFVDADGNRRLARLATFIEGRTLRGAATDAPLRRRLGAALAELALAFRDFDHAAAGRDLSWDLRHAGRMRAMLDELGPSDRRAVLRHCLERFDAETVPRLDRLPAQVVHNDLSKDNTVLAEDGRIGVIDFGDVVRTQRVNDLAVAMADHLGDPEAGAFAPAVDLARGYAGVEPLLPGEAALLYELVRARIATRIVGGEWRAARFPENGEYLGRNVERLWGVFVRLPEAPSAADAALLEALAEEGG